MATQMNTSMAPRRRSITPGSSNINTQPVGGATPGQYEANTQRLDNEVDTVQGQLTQLLDKNGAFMQRAVAKSNEQANARGLINSSIAASAGTAAAIDSALPIAQADASIRADSRNRNQDAFNQASQFNVDQANQFGKIKLQGDITTAENQRQREFETGERVGTQEFTSAENVAQRIFQERITQLEQGGMDRRQAEQLATQERQAELDRQQQTSLQSNQQQFQGTQAELDRAQQTALQTLQQTFQGDQASLDRAQQIVLQSSDQNFNREQLLTQQGFQERIANLEQAGLNTRQATELASQERQAELSRQQALALQQGQQQFQGTQAELERAQQSALQQSQQNFQAGQGILDRALTTDQNAAQRTFQAAQAELERAQQAALTDKSLAAQQSLQQAQQTFQAAQAGLDRGQQTSENQFQRDFQERITQLEQSGQDRRQAEQLAQQETLARLSEAGVTNRFDQEIALRGSQFNAEQIAQDRRLLQQHQNTLEQMGFTNQLNNQNVPTNFASSLAASVMERVNAIQADPNLEPDAKKAAVQNAVDYANSTLQWASSFYGTPLPGLTTPGQASTNLTPNASAPVTNFNVDRTVESLYAKIGRTGSTQPTSSEINYWKNFALQNGWTPQQLEANFMEGVRAYNERYGATGLIAGAQAS
jgi:hypothetical protein